MQAFEDEFGDVSLIDFTGNQLSIKFENKKDRSIGFLYSYIEKLK